MTRALTLALLLACAAGCGAAQEPPEEPVRDPLSDVPPETLFERAMNLAENGDFVRAEQYVRAAVARGFSEERGVRALVRICVATSRLRAALDTIEPYLEQHAEEWRLRYLAATLYLGLEQPDRARILLEQTLELAPDAAEPTWTLAVLLRDQVYDRDRSRALLTRYLELAPAGEHAAEARRSLERGAEPEAVTAMPVRLPPVETQETP